MDWEAMRLSRLLRYEKKLQRLGDPHPRCCICGVDDPAKLERNHLGGRANSDFWVWKCLNCHADFSDRQVDLVPDLRRVDPDRDPLKRHGAMLQGQSLLYVMLAVKTGEWAAWCLSTADHLAETNGPDWWRSLPDDEAPK